MNTKLIAVILLLLLVTTSCVTKKKYLIAENGRLEAIQRGDNLSDKLDICIDDNIELTKRLDALLKDTANLGRSIRNYESMLNLNLSEQ